MNIVNMAKEMNDVHCLIDAIIQMAATDGEEGREDYSLDVIRMQNDLVNVGADVVRTVRMFELPQEIAEYIRNAVGPYITVILALEDEEQNP